MTSGPWVKWDLSEVVRWSDPARGPRGGCQRREWGLSERSHKVNLQWGGQMAELWGQIAELWEPCQELSNLESGGVPPTYPRGQVHVMCRAAWAGKEMSHRVVGGVAVGEGRVIGPAYRVAEGLKHWAVAGSELGPARRGRFAPLVRPGQQLFNWVNWTGRGHEHFRRSVVNILFL